MTELGRPKRRGARTAGIAAVVVVVAGGAGVVAAKAVSGSSSGGGSALASVSQVAGSTQSDARYPGAVVLPVSVPKPDLVLTDTDGQPYDLRTRTAGKVTLLYFGYTNCPDVCPLNMALAAEAIAKMPPAQAKQVDVVFVSTDPNRDTPKVIRAWLDHFSTSFVGLTGPISAIHAAEATVKMSQSFPAAGSDGDSDGDDSGAYRVVHAGYTLVYNKAGTSNITVDESAQPAPYATTLEHLVEASDGTA